FLDATTPGSDTYDPLSEARINGIAQDFIHQNQNAVIYDEQGNVTDLFRRVNDLHQAATLKELKDYHDLASTLVNEGSVNASNLGPDNQLWAHYHFDHDMSVYDLSSKIFAAEDLAFPDFDPTNPDHWDKLKALIQAKYGDNPDLVNHKLQAIKSLLKANPENYFSGDNIVAKSGLTGRVNDFRIARNLGSILDTVR